MFDRVRKVHGVCTKFTVRSEFDIDAGDGARSTWPGSGDTSR